ncbi:hypothetical protein KXQ82_13560 [Mucilaginibacter sp. HMF5004]|uniref:hypothetical protein n=1 Tax=Mucilaginibacter rivuli TaxID=2857527 RepID=UPI001C5EC4BE|nr:hypothetical protein [Mucilaginibacter rivuli]MBW4890753.1 hypothetical protein [Mucilaginibacter rivuli]
MDKTTNTHLNISCSQCGAAIQSYNANTTFATCEYCGAETTLFDKNDAVTAKDSFNTEAKAIVFTNEVREIKTKILKWLIDDNMTPVNILMASTISALRKVYYPVYTFKGTYDGTYSVSDKYGKVANSANPVHGDFTVVKYGGEEQISQAEQDLVTELTIKAGTSVQTVPLTKISQLETDIVDAEPPQLAWDDAAEMKAAAFVYDVLKQQNPAAGEITHYLKYDVTSSDVLYYPLWTCNYRYFLSEPKLICVDEVSGEVIGEREKAAALGLSVFSLAKNVFRNGLVLWFLYYIARIALAEYVDKKYGLDHGIYDNLLISPLWGTYWMIRAVLICVVIPLTCCTVLYKYFEAKAYSRYKAIREKSLDNILSGKTKNIFEN